MQFLERVFNWIDDIAKRPIYSPMKAPYQPSTAEILLCLTLYTALMVAISGGFVYACSP